MGRDAAQMSDPIALPTNIWRVEDDSPVRRLDQALAASAFAAQNQLSRTRCQALVDAGAVLCDGRAITDIAFKARPGMTICVNLPTVQESELTGEAIPLNVVFEDSDLLVLDKPAGLVVHPAPGHETGTLVQALIAHCGDSLSGVGGVRRPGIVHRLDKDTSGLLVVAKNDAAHQGLAAQFADHGRSGPLEREYRAFVWGSPPSAAGTINAPLGRHATHREKIAVRKDGREAITHWRKLEDFGAVSLIACHLETGRTHQIRVHMAHLGHPVLGDAAYAAHFKTKAVRLTSEGRAALDALGRQALHAAVLGFEHPRTHEILRFESALPDDLVRLRRALSEP